MNTTNISIETQHGMVALAEALEKAATGSGIELAPETPSQKPAQNVVVRVAVDSDTPDTESVAKAAFRRITGSVIACLRKPDGSTRLLGGRWRYTPPKFERNIVVGRPSIVPTQKIHVHCRDCKADSGVFADSVIEAVRASRPVTCPVCGSASVDRNYTRVTCNGKPGKQFTDDILSGNAYAAEEIEAVNFTHRNGYDPAAALVMPRLWCGYSEKPDVDFVPEDGIAETVVRRGLTPPRDSEGDFTRPVAYMVPFDVMLPFHARDSKTKAPVLRHLVLETLGGIGWVAMSELEGRQHSAWKRRWLDVPRERQAFRRNQFSL